jgi:superfamily II DNA/RNA helicase
MCLESKVVTSVCRKHYVSEKKRHRRGMQKFEKDANLMLATDATQEGLNLQVAHIIVNYDLLGNPTRISESI